MNALLKIAYVLSINENKKIYYGGKYFHIKWMCLAVTSVKIYFILGPKLFLFC